MDRLTVLVDSRGHEPQLAALLPAALKPYGLARTKVTVCQLPLGDVHWVVDAQPYYIERKAMNTDDFARSFGSRGRGRLGSQAHRLIEATAYGGGAFVLVEGDWVPVGDCIFSREGIQMCWPLTPNQLYGILLRLQMEGLGVWQTRNLEHTAQVTAQLISMSVHPSSWLAPGPRRGNYAPAVVDKFFPSGESGPVYNVDGRNSNA